MGQAEDLERTGLQAFQAWTASRHQADLGTAVEHLRQAIDLPWTEPTGRTQCLFELVQVLAAGNEAVGGDYGDQVVDLTSAMLQFDPKHAWLTGVRGYARMLRYVRAGSLDDLNGAVIDFKQSLASTTRGDVAIYSRALNVAWASEARFDRIGSAGEDYRVVTINGVERWRGPRDLVLPISNLDALLAPDSGHPPAPPGVIPRIQRNLGNLLLRYALRVKVRPMADRAADMQRAVSLLEQAVAGADAGSFDRQSSAMSLVSAVHEGRAAGLLPPISADGSEGVDPTVARMALEATAGLPATAGGFPPARWEFVRGSELLQAGDTEQGLAVMQALAAPAGMVAAQEVPPEVGLAAAQTWFANAFVNSRWSEVVDAQRAATTLLERMRASDPNALLRDGLSAERGRLAAGAAFALAKTGALLDAVATLESSRATMIAERLERQRDFDPPAAEAAGPVVYLVTTEAGGLALVVADDQTIRPVWLDRLGGDAFAREVERYMAALDRVRRNSVIGLKAWTAQVAEMVAFLTAALAPLREATPGPLTLVPTGPLPLLPLAGATLGPETPTSAVTILPSQRFSRRADRPKLADRVVVTVDDSLATTRWEATGVGQLFAQSDTTPPDATVEAVLASFPPGGVVHFACHAEVVVGAPLDSAVILPGGARLTIGHLLRSQPAPVGLVVLSACESGVAGPYVVDEAVSLPVALLATGCRAVLSTLWLVEDLSSTLFMLRFYWEWRRQRNPAPWALSLAQHWQRKSTNGDKCSFVESTLVEAGVLGSDEARALADQLRSRCAYPDVNSYQDPYFWAGFYLMGVADDPLLV